MKIYHKPNCSTSQAALSLLREKGIEPEIIEYLKTPPTRAELKALLKMLGMPAHELIRTKEEIYKTQYQSKNLSEDEWIDAMIEHPILIERPIVVEGKKAVLGRPPQKILDLI